MHNKNPNDQVTAERYLTAFLDILHTRYELSEEDISTMLDDLRWLSKRRASLTKISSYALLTFVGLLVAVIFSTITDFIREFISRL
jgi:hypothetical protein